MTEKKKYVKSLRNLQNADMALARRAEPIREWDFVMVHKAQLHP